MAGHAATTFDGKAFPREFIDHNQATQAATIETLVVNEVPAPDLVRPCSLLREVRGAAQGFAPPGLFRDLEPLSGTNQP